MHVNCMHACIPKLPDSDEQGCCDNAVLLFAGCRSRCAAAHTFDDHHTHGPILYNRYCYMQPGWSRSYIRLVNLPAGCEWDLHMF